MQENLLCKFDLGSASGWIFNDDHNRAELL